MEIDREMTREEIEAEFDQEWVLINDPVLDEKTRLVKGRVRYHTPGRTEFDRAYHELAAYSSAQLFFGIMREDMQILL